MKKGIKGRIRRYEQRKKRQDDMSKGTKWQREREREEYVNKEIKRGKRG